MPGESSPRRPIAIIGGTYVERCQWPVWYELFGSGLRAAAALSGRDLDISLHTYVSALRASNLNSISAALRFGVVTSETSALYAFHYQHSLADPHCIAPTELPKTSLVVEADTVLCYGMMEGNAIVRARRAVYDPQSPLSPKNFHENGSSAKQLAILTNEAEARALSGLNDLHEAGTRLLSTQRAEVVIIKSGLKGATVFTDSGVTEVAAYRARSAFLIGSGDVFSAEFAYRWLIENCSPRKAAELASLAVAYYCQSPSVPIPRTLPKDFNPSPLAIDKGKSRSVYLAAPFFNMQQLWMVEEALAHLGSQGLKVFSPFHKIGVGEPAEVAQQDTDAIAKSDGLFALLDGYDPGTLFEIGFARALKKPVTVFVTPTEPTNLTMLVGSGCDVFHDFVSAIYWEASR
jgi:hypothetical protein